MTLSDILEDIAKIFIIIFILLIPVCIVLLFTKYWLSGVLGIVAVMFVTGLFGEENV